MVSSEGYSPQRSDLLPEIRQTTKKKGQVFKPAAFSVYTIQKDNEIFYNKFTKWVSDGVLGLVGVDIDCMDLGYIQYIYGKI